MLCIIIATLVFVILTVYFVWCFRKQHKKSTKAVYDGFDISEATKAIKMLEQGESNILEVSDQDFKKLSDKVYMAKLKHDETKEGYDDMKFPSYPPATLKALYYSGLPIRKIETNWAPDLYNRLHYWYPGFYTSGWSWWLRPGMKHGFASFWLKNNGNYYYIKN